MTAKEYLRQLKTLDNMINAKLLEKERVRTMGEKVTTSFLEKVQGGEAGDKISDVAIKLTELEDEILADIDNLIDLRNKASIMIDKLDNEKHKIVLSLYYLADMSFLDMSKALNKDCRGLRRLHGRALKNFEKILKMTL
jgi:putative RNA polymerase, sigma 28 subunit, fliA/whiG subfamily|uniref:Uncharacterized protein n=1 Tax=Siphoviridae sp. ctFiA6 TaxID=2823573 RepID=A0A8S5LGG5_9CAUD|nr:MAG TPA: Protein of unknown function DUF722 [Siphoviridae sp. ctFiA6]